MTCQHCQTWILDEEHRCHRCGRRVRSTPVRTNSNRTPGGVFPIGTEATARVFEPFVAPIQEPDASPRDVEQPELFPSPMPSARLIPFDSLTTRAERQSIRARQAGLELLQPVKTEKVQLKHARRSKAHAESQRTLDFHSQAETLGPPQSSIICDAPVAPNGLRLHAALIDALLMLLPLLAGAALFRYAGGEFSLDKHVLPFLLAAVATVPFFYKFLWTIAGRDSVGMRAAGLVLVDFDGNPPSRARRFQRMFGGFLSFLAAGIGLVWSLVDEDRLTWHDHISETFPTVE